MGEVKAQQMEALEMGMEYVQKLVPAIKEILPELRGEAKEDTNDFLNQIVEGINFIIEITNGTLGLINEKEEVLNVSGIEEKVQSFGIALRGKDNLAVANELEKGMLPFLDIFYQVGTIIMEKENV